MALNIKRISRGKKAAAERAEERKKKGGGGGSILRRLDAGITLVAVCPPHAEMDGVPYVQADQHFGLNPGHRAPCFSLAEDNEGVWSDEVHRMLAEFNKKRADSGKHVVDVEEGMRCPIQAVIDGSDPELLAISSAISDERAKSMRRKETYWFPYVPLAFAPLDDAHNFEPLKVDDQRPWLMPAPPELYMQLVDKIEQVYHEQDRDPTDPMAVTLFKIKYFKTNRWTYDVDFQLKTVTNPAKLPKGVRRQIKEMCVPGGAADPNRFIAGMLKDEDQILAIIKGSSVEEKKAAGDDKPKCFGFDCEPDDDECQACDHKKACAKKCKVDVPPNPDGTSDDADDEPDPEPEPEPKKKSKKTKKTKKTKKKAKPKPEPEPEEEEEDDVPDFLGEDPETVKAAELRDDDDDDDDDDDEKPPFDVDEEDDDDEPPVEADEEDDDEEGDGDGDDDNEDFLEMLRARKAARKKKKSK